MADPTLTQIVDAVIAAIAIDHRSETVPGVWDLSQPHAVAQRPSGAPFLDGPCVAVVRQAMRTFREADALGSIPLGTYGREVELYLYGWVPVTDDTDDTAARLATELVDDLIRALDADPSLGGVVLDSHTEEAQVAGNAGLPSGGRAASCALVLTCNWRATVGA